MKFCNTCKLKQPLDNFYRNTRSKDGRVNKCKTCRSIYHKEHYNKPEVREKARDNMLKRTYGISLEDYNTILENQGGTCAICDKYILTQDPNASVPSSMPLDHCHNTGRIRGILCTNCNHLLGKAKDDVELLKEAIEYLEKHNEVSGQYRRGNMDREDKI